MYKLFTICQAKMILHLLSSDRITVVLVVFFVKMLLTVLKYASVSSSL